MARHNSLFSSAVCSTAFELFNFSQALLDPVELHCHICNELIPPAAHLPFLLLVVLEPGHEVNDLRRQVLVDNRLQTAPNLLA
jgi:hypothetical protein